MTAAHEFRAWHDAAVPKAVDKPDRIDWDKLRTTLADITQGRQLGFVLRQTKVAKNTYYRAVNLKKGNYILDSLD